MIILDKFALEAISTALRITGAEFNEIPSYMDAAEANWPEVEQSKRIIEVSRQSALPVQDMYDLEVMRIARLIIKSITNE